MNLKTLPKRIPTNAEGVFYKRIINENAKEVDKVFLIRYKDGDKDTLRYAKLSPDSGKNTFIL